MVVGLPGGNGPLRPFDTRNPWELPAAGAIIIGAATLCWRAVTGGE
ncbi:MAG: hypothetical protein SPJ83_00230 [Helicobacter sp.]|nr:hypothetical protein [Helicobacter sp.]MDY5821216.1 hypothetical protein [Helicobacter sp.]